MICNRTKTGWEIVYQRAHALLAAQLIQHWQPAERPRRWLETLAATLEHDNGWQEWEPGDRLTPVQTPRDFRETTVEDLVQQSRRAITRSWHQSLWEGVLVSRHVSHLYQSLRADEPAIDALLTEQVEQRRQWRRQLGVKKAEVDAAYALLLWGDTFSLVLCQQHLPFGERALQVGTGPDGTAYFVTDRGDHLTVDPWPYATERFEVRVDTYTLKALTFEDEDALADALREAAPNERRWTLKRP